MAFNQAPDIRSSVMQCKHIKMSPGVLMHSAQSTCRCRGNPTQTKHTQGSTCLHCLHWCRSTHTTSCAPFWHENALWAGQLGDMPCPWPWNKNALWVKLTDIFTCFSSQTPRSHIVTMSIVSKATYRFNEIPIKKPMTFLKEIEQKKSWDLYGTTKILK